MKPKKDNIVQVDFRETYDNNMIRYSLYVLYSRYVPDIRDGLKPVQRRTLYAMWNDIKCISNATKRKSANTVGTVIAKYHAHGDCLFEDTLIVCPDGLLREIGGLYENGITTIEACGIDPETLEVKNVIMHDIRIGQYTDKIYHVKFSNGTEIKCTSNHPFMLNTGSYIKAENLTVNTEVMVKKLYHYDYHKVTSCDSCVKISNIWIEYVCKVPMYDFTVDETSNALFALYDEDNSKTDCIDAVCLHNSAVYEAMKCMTNWFEIKVPLIVYDSNSGSMQGGPQAAMRYTESYLSKFSLDCVIGELAESRQVVDWQNTFDNHTIEPESLPVQIPLLLVNGSFGIAIGHKIEIPKHSLNDVIDATINVLHNPRAKVVLIPDPCHKCEIIDTDWKKISNMGFGYYTQRGIIEIENLKNGASILHIRSVPDLIFPNKIMEDIEDLIKNNKLIGVDDIQDHSTEQELDIWVMMKKGADSNYTKQVLYNNTQLQDQKRVNMEVIDGVELRHISYKTYISYFIEYRRSVKFRLYNARLQKVETRLHQIEVYIKILESGDVENIIHMIRNQNSMEEDYLVNWLMNKLKITDLQAKFILHTEIGRLSKGHLDKYKEEQKNLLSDEKSLTNIITNPSLIDIEIENELLAIKNAYGIPRRSVLISEAEASNIPEGEFKVIVTEQNFVKKMQVADPYRAFRGDQAKYIIIGDNSKDILLFDQMGKVFRLPINNIAFTERNSPGIDIRLLVKKLTSNIISVMYLPILEDLNERKSKYYLVIVTRGGLIKKIDLADMITATSSGVIYSKLNQGDEVCEVLIASHRSDIVVYTKSKALRISMDSIPYLKRATLGNISIRSKDPVDGISVITAETNSIIVVTAKGRFNRISQSALERSATNKTGYSVIKLGRGDYIKKIFSCINNSKIRIIRQDEVIEIETDSIPVGSSISTGVKLCKEGIIKAELIRG
jgi:DNA gyrase subunit A